MNELPGASAHQAGRPHRVRRATALVAALAVMAAVLVLVGSGRSLAQTPAPVTTAVPAATAAPVTAAPSATPAFTSGRAAASATVTAPPALEVTRVNDGQTLRAVVGQGVTIRLGADLDWTVDLQPAGILTAVPGVNARTRDVQAILRAVQAGTVTITGQGKPQCAQGQACPQFIVSFRATVIVDQPGAGPAPIATTVQSPVTGQPAASPAVRLPNTGARSTSRSPRPFALGALLVLLGLGGAGALWLRRRPARPRQ